MIAQDVYVAELARKAAPYNPRKISSQDFASLRRSLRTFGVVEPIVVNQRTDRVVGGHQRIAAAAAEGLETLPVVYVDLDDITERQLNVALNRIHGEWDRDALERVIQEIAAGGGDLALTGFDPAELDRITDSIAAGFADPDAVPDRPAEPSTQLGDLIVLGRHRLLCGDSALEADVERLLEGVRVQLVNTDPPYNVDVQSRSAIAPKAPLENDDLPDAEFARLLEAWFRNLAAVLEPGRSFYVWGGYSNISLFPATLAATGLHFSQLIVWDKQWPVMSHRDFMSGHESAFYGWREGAPHYFNPDVKNAIDIWQVKKVAPASMVHLTEKPVELAERAMLYSSRRGENVLDLFGGSGSTLIAAERMERRAFLMELDPAYCDVIVQRWQAFTGWTAEGWRGNG